MLLFVNDLTVIDFSYLCENRGIVGDINTTGQSSHNHPSGNQSIHLNCPDETYAFLDTTNINKESIASYLRGIIRHELPANVQQLQLSLRAEQIDTAYYHYNHGLKKHDGNCQRIVHEGVGKGAIAISN
ncbi:MAG: hypothetical protein GY712_01780 [Oceanicoccus sp.]|uniref:hypothetical protein n=1 Tax=Oceanicoccus sp. TaxID=2691044 RepID=UPI00262E0C1E|nr:hypothetical protein [Oceanicoccus sp.]MCP3906731.1 hypothetical protein [Oceanicoccus sp.]